MSGTTVKLTKLRNMALAAGLGLAVAFAPQPAFAAGGGGSGGSGGGGGGNGAASTTCPKGKVWSTSQRKCVEARSGILPDEELTDYAFVLAEDGRYREALATLDLLRDPDTPKALNYRGYVTRHLGRLDEGIAYYLKSVALAPQYAQVREYLGEAYLIKGRADLAKEQLSAIEAICGMGCEEYRDLAGAIARYPDL